MNVSILRSADRCELMVEGSMTVEDAALLKDGIRDLTAVTSLLVDVSALEDIDAPVLQVLAAAQRSAGVAVRWSEDVSPCLVSL